MCIDCREVALKLEPNVTTAMAGTALNGGSEIHHQQEFWGTVESNEVSISAKAPEISSAPYYCALCRVQMTGPEPYNQHVLGSSHARQAKRQALVHETTSMVQENVLQQNSPINFTNQIPDFHCNICNVSTSGIEPYQQHIKGIQHFKKVKQREQQRTLHNSPMLRRETNAFQQNETLPPANQVQSTGVPNYYCSVCNTTMSGIEPYQQHLKGMPHLKRLKNQEMMVSFQSTAFQNRNPQPSVSPIGVSNAKQQVAVPSNFYCTVCDKQMSGYEPYMAHVSGSQHAKVVRRQQVMGGFDGTLKSFSAMETDRESYSSSDKEISELSDQISSKLHVSQTPSPSIKFCESDKSFADSLREEFGHDD